MIADVDLKVAVAVVEQEDIDDASVVRVNYPGTNIDRKLGH